LFDDEREKLIVAVESAAFGDAADLASHVHCCRVADM
jgi:hypothetical protein